MKSIDLSKSKFGDRFLDANGNEYVYIGKQFLEGTIGHMLVSYYNEEDLLLTPDNTYLQCIYEYFNDGTPRFASHQRLVKKTITIMKQKTMKEKKPLLKKVCLICGEEFEVPSWRPNAKYCSVKCQREGIRAPKETTCTQCGKKFHQKKSHKDRYCKNGVYFCSRQCLAKYKKTAFAGENNHQYGLKGKLNASFQDKETSHKNNKITDIFVHVDNHPRPNRNSRVLLHRHIVEQNYQLFDKKYFEEINGFVVLRKGVGVHHINGNHDDNRIENLMPVTKAEHTAIHNKQNEILRDKTNGRIIGIIKRQVI